jgi:Protein of unknown function (DUF1493)
METRQIEFEKLRHAYVIVKHFLETEGYKKVTSLNNKVEADLGLSGDDNSELLDKFVTEFELDHKNFDYDKHFYSEGELFSSEAALANLLNLSIWLPLKTIELITFNRLKIEKPKFPVTPDREVSDLTFKDLLTWYIEKKYMQSDQIKYEIKKA